MEISTPEKFSEAYGKPVFARHETFHPRFGWLKKGFDGADNDAEIFLKNDAHIRLGVGKNMALSIRYWCIAFKILEELLTSNRSILHNIPTDFGSKMFQDTGWDPYLDNPGSLWLLHWKLLQSSCLATSWFYVFNGFRKVDFLPEDLLVGLQRFRDQIGSRVADSSLQKDVSCLLRMYVEPNQRSTADEESLICPFSEMGIIQATSGSRYSFIFGSKPTLPDEVILFACLEFAACVSHGQKSISISRLLYEVNSPGLVFKLTESALCFAIEQIARKTDKITLSENAGIIQLTFKHDPRQLAFELLNTYYTNNQGEI